MSNQKLTRRQKEVLEMLKEPDSYLCYGELVCFVSLRHRGAISISLKTFRAIEPLLIVEGDNGRTGKSRALFYVLKAD